jgi:hypothetical protein
MSDPGGIGSQCPKPALGFLLDPPVNLVGGVSRDTIDGRGGRHNSKQACGFYQDPQRHVAHLVPSVAGTHFGDRQAYPLFRVDHLVQAPISGQRRVGDDR